MYSQQNKEIDFSLSPFAPENLISRDGFGHPVPRKPAHFPHSGWIINHQSSIINHQSSIINHQSSIINHQSPIINHQSPIINHQSSIINHQSSIINHQSSIINHQSGAYSRDSYRFPQRRPHIIRSTAIGSLPSSSGHAIAYWWRSLPRVRRHSARSPELKVVPEQRVLPFQVSPWTMQLMFSLFPHPLLV